MAKGNDSPTSEALGEAAALQASGIGQTFLDESEATLKGARAGSQEVLSWGQKAFKANLMAWHALMSCRSPVEAMAVHSRLLQQHLRTMVENGLRTSMVSWNAALRENDTHV